MRLLGGKPNDYMGIPQTSVVAVALIAGLIFLGGRVYSQTPGQDEEPHDAASREEESEQPADDGKEPEPASDRLEAAGEKIHRDIEALAEELGDEALAIKLDQLNIADRLRETTDVAGERAVPVEVEGKVFVKNRAAETQEIVGEITEKAAEAHEVIWKKVLQAAEELRRSGEEATEKIGEAHEAMRDRLIRSAEEARSNFTEGIPLNRLKRAAATEQSVTVPMEIDPLSQMLKAELEAVRLRSAELDSREADLQARLRKMDKVFEEKGREAQRRGEKVTERAAEVEKEEESILKYWERMLQPKDKSESAKAALRELKVEFERAQALHKEGLTTYDALKEMEKALGEKAKRIIAEGHMLDENSSSAARPPYTLYNEHLSAEEDPLRQIVDLSFREMPLKDVVKILEDLGEIKIVTDLPLDGIVTVNLQDVPLGRGMEAIIRMQGLGIVEEDVGFRITTWDEAVETRRETRMISLGHANAGEIAALLKDVLTEATDLGAIRIAANETRNVVILSGPSELVEEFADLIQELDTANPVILTATQVITLDHSVNAEDMIRAATKLLSDVGTVSYDLRSHQLIFTDLPVNIAEIRAKVDDATRRAVKEQRKGGEPSSQSSDAESNSLNAQEAPSTLFNAHLSAEDDPLRQVVDLEFKEMPLENIVQILEDLGQVKIVTGLPLDAIVSANLEEIPLGRAMETIFRMQGLGFVREDDGFRITTWDEAVKARRERIEGKTEERAIPPYKVAIQVKYAKEADLVPAVTLVLSESGTVKFDARSGHLLVTDTPAKVEEIRALVESLDVIDDIEQYEKTQTLNRELKRLKAEEKAIREQLSDLERLESEPRKGE